MTPDTFEYVNRHPENIRLVQVAVELQNAIAEAELLAAIAVQEPVRAALLAFIAKTKEDLEAAESAVQAFRAELHASRSPDTPPGSRTP